MALIRPSFDDLYRRLVCAAKRYHSIPRSPHNIDALADAHWELHLARRDMSDERARLEALGEIYTSDDRLWLDRLGIFV